MRGMLYFSSLPYAGGATGRKQSAGANLNLRYNKTNLVIVWVDKNDSTAVVEHAFNICEP
jgi:hypothetical protein